MRSTSSKACRDNEERDGGRPVVVGGPHAPRPTGLETLGGVLIRFDRLIGDILNAMRWTILAERRYASRLRKEIAACVKSVWQEHIRVLDSGEDAAETFQSTVELFDADAFDRFTKDCMTLLTPFYYSGDDVPQSIRIIIGCLLITTGRSRWETRYSLALYPRQSRSAFHKVGRTRSARPKKFQP